MAQHEFDGVSVYVLPLTDINRGSTDGVKPMTRLCTCPDSLKSKSELFNKRNQPIWTACKTCGGSFLVDGIRSISGNMLSTVSLEVAKSINPELSWKAVTKGRRSRKTVARRVNGGMKVINRSPKRVGDFSGSDSDKIAEAGCWSSDKVEHVPIKKRRHLLQTSSVQSQNPSIGREDSLSPQSLVPSMPPEDRERTSVYSHSSDHWSSDPYSSGLVLRFGRKAAHKFDLSDRGVDAKISKVATGELYYPEDFSGIALLADAACISYMVDDLDNAKEAHAMIACAAPGGSAGSTPRPKELTAPDRGDMMLASNTEVSTVNESAGGPEGFAEFTEPAVVNGPVSPKVDRMHWDLNTLMDTWEQPPKDSSMDSAFAKGLNDGAQKEKPKAEIWDKKVDFEYYRHNSGKCVPPDQNGAISEFAEVCKLDSVSVNDSHCTKLLDSLSAQRETAGELVTGDTSLADSSSVKSHNAPCMPVSDGLVMSASDGLILTQIRDSSVKAAGYNKAAVSEVPFTANPGCESASKYIDQSDPIMTSEVFDTSILNAMGVESSDSNPTGTDFSNHSSKCEDLSASKASLVESQSVTVEPMEQYDNILAIGSQMLVEGNEVISTVSDSRTFDQVEKCTTSGNDSSRSCNEGLQIDDPSQFTGSASAFEDSHKSDISQEDHSQMISREHVTKIEAGYDSPFEDGELRGSILYSLEDNEIENGENECIDFESDGRDDMYFDASDYPASEIVEAGSDGSQSIEKRISSTSACPEVGFVRGRSPRNIMRRQFNRDDNSIDDSGGKKGFGTGSGSTTHRFSDKIGGKEDAFRKGHTSERMAAYEFRGSYMEEIDSKTNRGKLQSRAEGPLYLDVTDGNSATRKYQNRPHNRIGSYYRPGREVSPDNFVGRYRPGYNSQDRGATDGQWDSWNSRNCYPNAYHGYESHNYSRRRDFANSADKFGGLNSRDHQQSVNFPPEGVRRPLVRRRSSVERDDYSDVHRRLVPVRGGYQSRSGAESFSQRAVRGIRDEGYERIPGDGNLSSVRMPPYLPRGERTGSPASGRVARIPMSRRRSRSRSRTPSPHPWHAPRERNFSTRRRHSRSPELRSDARMKRMPFRKHGFTANCGEDFSFPTRDQCPSERSSRWIDERNFAGQSDFGIRSYGSVEISVPEMEYRT
ncbi:hypothetical protein CQW23_07728 [Capsicum baccatum]|uniref:Uncharacterized protein n=1 Tax=Capsicum baccatum TaxID=33114 RepID=A0A2G2X6Z9_CAPBA|nr:hypothetical protein CQW23_07728 [Capsicum baccatum]